MTTMYSQSGLWQDQKLLVIAEFEAGMTSGKGSIPKQHDPSASVQNRFAADTKKWGIPSMKTVMNLSP